MIRAAFAHLVRAVAGALVRWAHKIEGGPIATIEGFGKEFCMALGLNPSGTGDITLHVPVEGAVTATVEKIFKGVNSDGLLELMTHAGEYVTYAQQSTALSPRVIAHCIGSHMWLDGLDEQEWDRISACLPILTHHEYTRTLLKHRAIKHDWRPCNDGNHVWATTQEEIHPDERCACGAMTYRERQPFLRKQHER